MIRPLRLVPALVVASLLTSLLLGALRGARGVFDEQATILAAVFLLVGFALWLAGCGFLVVISREGIRRADTLLLGAGLALISPLAASFVATHVFPGPAEAFSGWGDRDVPLGSSLMAGLLDTPFGCLGGWIVWRLGFPPQARQDLDDGRTTRLAESLGKRRLLLALCQLPLLPVALLAGALNYATLVAYSDLWLKEIWWQLTGWVLLAAWLVAIGGGMTLVALAATARGRISGAGCLALGAAAAFLLPSACALIGAPLGRLIPAVMVLMRDAAAGLPAPQSASLLFIVGAFLLPFGLPGGWLFWRLGVRPAPPPPPIADPAAVFD